MTDALSDLRRARLSELVSEHLGLQFPPQRWNDLERGIAAAAAELGFDDAEACLVDLASRGWERREVDVLASHLTVGETYFFRDGALYRALENEVLPAIVRRCERRRERRLRIWSAGCASGEEPYSIAMLLEALLPGREQWNVHILATDVNPRALRKAEAGVYGEWSLRDTPAPVRDRFFTRRRDGRFELEPRIRSRVAFAQLNLIDDGYPSLANGTNGMDLILCRNVLMYLRPEHTTAVVRRFHLALAEDGWLTVGACEASHTLFDPFTAADLPDVYFYRKGSGREHPPEPPPRWPAPVDPRVAGPRASEAHVTDLPPAPPREPAPAFEDAARLFESGRWAEAVESALASLAAAPGEPRAAGLLARAYANLGRLAEAREWGGRAVAAAKLDPSAHYLLATIMEEQGEPEAAARALGRALYLDPGFILAHFTLATLARRQGRREAAARHLDNALGLLRGARPEEPLPGADGLTAGRLAELIAGLRPESGAVTGAT